MLRLRPLLTLSIAWLPAACATAKASFQPLGPSHPASPEAPELPIADPSACLREGDVATEAAPAVPAPAGAPAAAPGAYVCPMHPEISAAEPGRCSVCGMKLVPRPPQAPQEEEHPHDG